MLHLFVRLRVCAFRNSVPLRSQFSEKLLPSSRAVGAECRRLPKLIYCSSYLSPLFIRYIKGNDVRCFAVPYQVGFSLALSFTAVEVMGVGVREIYDLRLRTANSGKKMRTHLFLFFLFQSPCFRPAIKHLCPYSGVL